MRQLCDGEDVDKVEEQLEVRRPPLALRWAQEADVGDDRNWGLAIGCHPQSMEPGLGQRDVFVGDSPESWRRFVRTAGESD